MTAGRTAFGTRGDADIARDRAAGSDGVHSVERALALLEALADPGGELGVSDLRQATGLPYATVHRLLATLVAQGYVRQNLDSHKYALGARLIRLADSAGRQLGSWARPFLTELMEVSGETANLAVLEGDHVVYVAQVASQRHRMRMFTEVGRRVLPHSNAVGKVALAFRPGVQVEALLERTGLPARMPGTITDRADLLAQLDQIAAQGFAIDDGEEEIGVRCLAVPVFGVWDSVAAMSLSAPEGRLQREDWERILPEMQRISAAITGTLAATV